MESWPLIHEQCLIRELVQCDYAVIASPTMFIFIFRTFPRPTVYTSRAADERLISVVNYHPDSFHLISHIQLFHVPGLST